MNKGKNVDQLIEFLNDFTLQKEEGISSDTFEGTIKSLTTLLQSISKDPITQDEVRGAHLYLIEISELQKKIKYFLEEVAIVEKFQKEESDELKIAIEDISRIFQDLLIIFECEARKSDDEV